MPRPLICALCLVCAAASAAEEKSTPPSNPPWWPSLQAFEHYDSARSHVFSQAEFLGSRGQRNVVLELYSSPFAYPSGYNMAYLNAEAIFIQGGSYGGILPSIGPYVARVDPQTLEPVWKRQLVVNDVRFGGNGDWNYPGGMAIMNDGFIYVVSGSSIYKVDPASGTKVDQLQLPTMVKMQANWPCNNPVLYSDPPVENKQNTAYNGINALPDGTIILKSLYRVANTCTADGPDAFKCNPNNNVPASILVAVDPGRNGAPMKKIGEATLPHFVGARPTITRYNGVDYVYLLSQIATPIRYSVKDGVFTFDETWQPQAFNVDGKQQAGGSVIVMNEWIVGATNSVPATGPITIFAIHQGDPTNVHWVQPFKNDPVPQELAFLFKGQAPNPPYQCVDNNNPPPPDQVPPYFGADATSWAGMSLEADPENGLFYGVETLARKVAAFRISKARGIETVWKETQTTTEWATLIGPRNQRVWVGTDIPGHEIPGGNHNNSVVWRDARTGRELARSQILPTNMTQGSAVQPGYDGNIYFPGQQGMLIRLTPQPERPAKGAQP